MPPDKSLPQLVAASQLGDSVATELLLRDLEPLIHRISLQWLRSLSDWYELEDLEQEARLVVLECLPTYQADSGAPFEVFAAKSIRNTFHNLHIEQRRQKRGSGLPVISLNTPVGRGEDGERLLLGDVLTDTRVSDPEEAAVALDLMGAIENTLTEEQRRLAEGLIEGLSLTEIAQEMGVSFDTARGIRSRVREKLRPFVEEG